MVDQKITELTELSVPEANDLMVIVDDPAGTPVTKKITVGNSMIDATTTTKGKASFNSDDFTVSSGAVSLKNKTSYWSANGTNFQGRYPNTASVEHNVDTGTLKSTGDDIEIAGPVFLPHGAVVTAVEVEGTGTWNWEMWRTSRTAESSTIMATAQVDSADTSISNATIDNANYTYFIQSKPENLLQSNDTLISVRITYTTDYD